MSKILSALATAAGTKQTDGETVTAFVTRIVPIISELDDKQWDKIPETSQDYYNDAADAINAGTEVPVPPDYVAPEAKPEAKPAAGRRGARAAAGPAAAVDTPYVPKVGDNVEATNKRGKVYTGAVIELDDGLVVIDTGTEEVEVVTEGATFKLTGAAKATQAAPEAPKDPKVGDTVVLVNSRDMSFTGKLLEQDDDLVILEVEGEEKEFMKVRVKSVTIVAASPAVVAAAGRRAARAETPPADKVVADKPAATNRATKGTNGGVSVTTRIRELIAADLTATMEDVGKVMRAEGLEFRDATLSLTFAETHKVVNCLKAVGKLKG